MNHRKMQKPVIFVKKIINWKLLCGGWEKVRDHYHYTGE